MERRGRPTAPAPNHRYPAVELLKGVKIVNGKYVVDEMASVPTIDGIPDPRGILEEVGRRLEYNQDYFSGLDLTYFNNHHGAGERKDYYGLNDPSIVAFREDPNLRIDMFIPFHNLAHLTQEKAPLPNRELMRARGKELQISQRLFSILDNLLWLESMHGEGVQQYNTAADYIERNGYKRKVPFYQRRSYLIATGKIRPRQLEHRFKLPTYSMFLDELSRAPSPEFDLLPNPEELATLSPVEAHEALAKIATAEAVFSVEESTSIIIAASQKASYRKAA